MKWESEFNYSMRELGSDGKGELFPVYKFVSEEGYQVTKSVKEIDAKGLIIWLFSAWRPKHKKYKLLKDDKGPCLGHFVTSKEAAAVCVDHYEVASVFFAEQALAASRGRK